MMIEVNGVGRISAAMIMVIILVFAQGLIYSCASGPEKPKTILSQEQKTALEAIDMLQMQMKAQHLYSTFPGKQHDCFPADTSFLISKAEFLVAMEGLLKEYCTDLSSERRNDLAGRAVLAQAEYHVHQCYGSSLEKGKGSLVSQEISRSGKWIIPNVLDRKDLVLEW